MTTTTRPCQYLFLNVSENFSVGRKVIRGRIARKKRQETSLARERSVLSSPSPPHERSLTFFFRWHVLEGYAHSLTIPTKSCRISHSLHRFTEWLCLRLISEWVKLWWGWFTFIIDRWWWVVVSESCLWWEESVSYGEMKNERCKAGGK